MSPFEETPFEAFVDEVEISITDSVDSLSAVDAARLYAELLDTEQRLGAFRDVLALLDSARP